MDKFSAVRIAMREHTSGRLGDIGQPYIPYTQKDANAEIHLTNCF